MTTATQRTEAYRATRNDGTRFSIHVDEAGQILLAEGRGSVPEPVTARAALQYLLEGVGDAGFSTVGDSFPALRDAMLRNLASLDDPTGFAN